MTGEPAAPAHPSAFDFDLALLGEPTEAFREHLGACAACRQRLESRAREQQEFASSPWPEQSARLISQKIRQARRARWLWSAPVALLAASAALLLVVQRPDEGGGAVSLKGAPRIDAYVKSAEAAPRRLPAGARLRKSDRVQLAYQAAGYSRVTLFVLEQGCEAVSAGTWTAETAGGMLPTSWALSGEGGGRLYLVFSDALVPSEAFAAALRVAPRGCESDWAPDLETGAFVARGISLLPEVP